MLFAPKNLTAVLALLTLGALTTPAEAQEKPAKVVICAACHGEQGKSTLPIYPNLAGQHRSYLEQALKAYRSGRDKNALMNPQAMNLTNQDIEDLAAWYSSRPAIVYVPTVDPGTGTIR